MTRTRQSTAFNLDCTCVSMTANFQRCNYELISCFVMSSELINIEREADFFSFHTTYSNKPVTVPVVQSAMRVIIVKLPIIQNKQEDIDTLNKKIFYCSVFYWYHLTKNFTLELLCYKSYIICFICIFKFWINWYNFAINLAILTFSCIANAWLLLFCHVFGAHSVNSHSFSFKE